MEQEVKQDGRLGRTIELEDPRELSELRGVRRISSWSHLMCSVHNDLQKDCLWSSQMLVAPGEEKALDSKKIRDQATTSKALSLYARSMLISAWNLNLLGDSNHMLVRNIYGRGFI